MFVLAVKGACYEASLSDSSRLSRCRQWYFFERQAALDIVSIIPVLIDAIYMGTTGSVPLVQPDGPMFLR